MKTAIAFAAIRPTARAINVANAADQRGKDKRRNNHLDQAQEYRGDLIETSDRGTRNIGRERGMNDRARNHARNHR